MLTLENIFVTFNAGTPDENRALKNINLKINAGDFVTVIGSNGAGKSTLQNVISGNVPSSSGKIFLQKKSPSHECDVHNANATNKNCVSENTSLIDITKEKEYKRAIYISRIFQNPLLGTAGKMTLEDNMTICAKKGWKGLRVSLNAKMRNEFRERLAVLNMGLENRLSDNVEQFSGGQRQALTLLMAVMSRPQILLLDEHTAALDPENASIVMELTRRFASDYNLTVLMITHNMQHALEYGNRLMMMDAGEIIIDIDESEKQNITPADLQTRFRQIKKRELNSDAMLLQ